MNQTPLFTIIIPTFSRHLQLINCIESIDRLHFPKHLLEVIIVDDGNMIPVKPFIEKLAIDLNPTILSEKKSGPARARNFGAKHARGKYIAFIDDDCMVSPDWLELLIKRLNKYPRAMVGGYTANALPGNPFSAASQLIVDYLYHQWNGNHGAAFLTSNNMIVPLESFLSMGGFNEQIHFAGGEDREFCIRWQKKQYAIIYEPKAVIHHSHHLGLFSFVNQHFRYGKGKWFCRHFPKNRIRWESMAFYTNLFNYMKQEAFLKNQSYLLVILLLLSQYATAAGFLWQTVMNAWVRR
jgi:cellulose synthase/poly-beta-1,6-N-acetylglucosamine synthase-like glycosyltransferase